MSMTMGRVAYPSDLTEKQWELLAPLIPEPSLEGRQPFIERREIVNGILYVLSDEGSPALFACGSSRHALFYGRWPCGSE